MPKTYKPDDYDYVTLTPKHHSIQVNSGAVTFEAKKPTEVKVGHPPGVSPTAEDLRTHKLKTTDTITMLGNGRIVIDTD